MSEKTEKAGCASNVFETNMRDRKDYAMKKLVEVQEVEGEGLMSLLGQRITLFALNYIYTGKLMGVNASCVLLDEASIVYETGELNTKTWKDAQSLPGPWYVQIGSIESFGILKS